MLPSSSFFNFLYVPEVEILFLLFFIFWKKDSTEFLKMFLEHLHIAQAIWAKSPTGKQYGAGLMKTWSGSWDVKALIWSIKYNFSFMTPLPRAPFTSPNCEHLQCNCLKKMLLDFFSCLSFLHLTAVMCDQCIERGFLSCLADPYQLYPLKLKGWLLLEPCKTSRFSFPTMLFPLRVPFFCVSLSTFLSAPQHLQLACAQNKKPRRNFSDAQMAWN